MADTASLRDSLPTTSAATTIVPGQPHEQLQIEAESTPDEEIQYPTGVKLWLNLASMVMVSFLHGLVRQ